MSENPVTGFIMLKNVRCDWPRLYNVEVKKGKEFGMGVTLLLDNDSDAKQIKKINKIMQTLLDEKNKGKKLSAEKYGMRDADEAGYDEYEGCTRISAGSKKRPIVLDAKGTGVISDEEDCKIYGGCFVNAKVRPWFQNNDYGKRVNFELVAIQHNGDGEAFDGSHVSVDTAVEGFGSVDESADQEDDFLE